MSTKGGPWLDRAWWRQLNAGTHRRIQEMIDERQSGQIVFTVDEGRLAEGKVTERFVASRKPA